MTEKKTNEQTILEAKANIDIARMMLALNNIKTSTNWLSVNALETMEKWFKEAMRFLQAMQELKNIKDCVFNEAQIAKDIVDWIKSKSMYLEKIQEYKVKLDATIEQNNEFILENKRIKSLLVKFIERFDISQDQIDIDFIKNELLLEAKTIRGIQEWAWAKFVAKLPERCTIEENPFK